MTLIHEPGIDAAGLIARENFDRNLESLIDPINWQAAPDLLWLRARDGSLTAKTSDGRWLIGNSLPRRTSERMLRNLNVSQSVSCFLDVPHAAFLKAALLRLAKSQAIIAVIPDPQRLWILLHCEDFSEEIGKRLWFAAGQDWSQNLADVFGRHPGLSTPNAFIRTSLTDESTLQSMIGQAQEIFATETRRRNQLIERCIQNSHPNHAAAEKRICLIAPSTFRLWDSAAEKLTEMLPAQRCDPDHPSSSSPLALAMAAHDCDGVVAANIARADARGIISPDRPWITWITRPIIPAYAGADRDHLFLADPAWSAAAKQMGWPDNQVSTAGWPRDSIPHPPNPGKYFALIADTKPVAVEPDHFDLSSHALLWETIRQHLKANPFDLRSEPAAYLAYWLKRCHVAAEGLDSVAFIEQLILPTYQQGIVRILLRSGFPLQLFGAGWAEIDEFVAHAHGIISDTPAMRNAIIGAMCLVHAWPVRHAHPVEAVGHPIIFTASASEISFLQSARLAARGELAPPSARPNPISTDLIFARL